SKELFDAKQHLEHANARLENLLNEKTSELDGAFLNIIDPYVVMDLDFNVINMNKSAKEFLGFDHRMETVNLGELVHEDYREYTKESMATLLEVGTLQNYRAKIKVKNGTDRFVQINSSIIYDQKRKPLAAQGIIRDITSETEIKQLLSDQKKQLDVIVDNSPLGFVLTVNGQIVKANSTFCGFLGYNELELCKLKVSDISFKEDQPASRSLMEEMNSGKIDNFIINKRYKRKDGSILWAKTNVNAVRDKNGVIKYQLAIVEDITVEREKQLMIEVINDVAKAILGKMDIHEIAWEITRSITHYLGSEDCIIYLVDRDKKYLEQIAAFGDKVDREGEIHNKVTLDLGQGVVGAVASTGKAELIGDTSKDKRYVVDDAIRYSEITVPIISEGEVIGVIDSEHPEKNYYTRAHLETLKNIARLVAMQLKNAINLRERLRTEEQNRKLLEELQRSNEGLKEYAHIVSHDLKSPLRSINALASWLHEDYVELLDEAGVYNLKMIQEKTESMDNLINGILKYSSIEYDKLESETVDVNEVVKHIREIIFVPEHVQIVIMNPLPVIVADDTKIHQLLQNLISNAVSHIDKDEGLVKISSEESDTHWKFKIEDNGVGIAREYHEKIFKVFQSLDAEEKSTGIGLSIVKKIVDLYEGEIWLESEPGSGTCFYFTLIKK
ncbi:MAG: PAS domain S-box protein, partial [Eudoraea sp.]|nr:PAS domain S-box protein [Eudoraea sp.]